MKKIASAEYLMTPEIQITSITYVDRPGSTERMEKIIDCILGVKHKQSLMRNILYDISYDMRREIINRGA